MADMERLLGGIFFWGFHLYQTDFVIAKDEGGLNHDFQKIISQNIYYRKYSN